MTKDKIKPPSHMQSIIHFEFIGPGIQVGFVSIPGLLEVCCPSVPIEDYHRRPPMGFHREMFTHHFLASSELEAMNGFKSLKKQVEWMSGRFAVKKLISEISPGIAEEEILIAYEDEGAPYLKDHPEFFISISHSNAWASAAVSVNGGRVIGVDMEKVEDKNLEFIVRAAFSDREKRELKNPSNNDIYRIWTIKEAYLKFIKKGLNESLKKVEVLNGRIHHRGELKDDLEIRTKPMDGDYVFTAVFNRVQGFGN